MFIFATAVFFPAGIAIFLFNRTSRGGTPMYHVQLAVSFNSLVAVMVTAVMLFGGKAVLGGGL